MQGNHSGAIYTHDWPYGIQNLENIHQNNFFWDFTIRENHVALSPNLSSFSDV